MNIELESSNAVNAQEEEHVEQESTPLTTCQKIQWHTSAYWNVNPNNVKREQNDAIEENVFRFDREINRKCIPIVDEKTSIPRTLDYTLCGMHLITDDGNTSTGGLNEQQKINLETMQRQENPISKLSNRNSSMNAEKIVPNAYSMTAQNMTSRFDENTLQALNRGNAKCEAVQEHVAHLHKMPFTSENPYEYCLTSNEYCNWSNLHPYTNCVTESPSSYSTSHALTPRNIVYNSRYNNVTRNAPVRRKRTFDALQNSLCVDVEELQRRLSESHASALPIDYKPYNTSNWRSTTHRTYCPYSFEAAQRMNTTFATEPEFYYNGNNFAVNDAPIKNTFRNSEGNAVKETEYSDNYQNRFNLAVVDKQHTSRSVFDIQKGGYTMHHSYHHPQSDVVTGESYKPSNIVPGQYTSMLQRSLHGRNNLS